MLLTIIKHLLIWSLVLLLLSTSALKWGWTITPAYDSFPFQVYGAITNALIFYITSLYLIPKYLNQKRKRPFYAYSLVLVFAMTGIEFLVDQYLGKAYQNQLYLADQELSPLEFVLTGWVYILPINLFYYVIAFVYRIPIDRKLLLEREHALEREKLESELKFLKAQIHPHTFFNGLNSIYHLIDFEPDKAKELLVFLSNSMRYHLYESNSEYVLLEKEIHYLRQYIALHSIRLEEDARIDTHWPEEEDIQNLQIAPLLLTPFIENAFKFISHYADQQDNSIEIRLAVNKNILTFECSNTLDESESTASDIGGIGLKNVRSRLDLLYGDTYQLTRQQDREAFKITLTLPLKNSLCKN